MSFWHSPGKQGEGWQPALHPTIQQGESSRGTDSQLWPVNPVIGLGLALPHPLQLVPGQRAPAWPLPHTLAYISMAWAPGTDDLRIQPQTHWSRICCSRANSLRTGCSASPPPSWHHFHHCLDAPPPASSQRAVRAEDALGLGSWGRVNSLASIHLISWVKYCRLLR